MGIVAALYKAYVNGKKARGESALKDERQGKRPSIGKAMARGAGASIKGGAPDLIRTFLRRIMR